MAISFDAVIPCYNGAATLPRALKSVIDQTYSANNIIVVNDGSDSKNSRLISATVQRFRDLGAQIVLLETSNSGVSSARNSGWGVASSEYVAFLDCDDVWHKEKLRRCADVLNSHISICLIGHLSERIRRRTLDTNETDLRFNSIGPKDVLFKNPFVTCSSVVVKTEIPNRFDISVTHSEDLLLWWDIVESGCSAVKIDLTLSYYFKHPYGDYGLGSNFFKIAQGEYLLFKSVFVGHVRFAVKAFAVICFLIWLLRLVKRFSVYTFMRVKNILYHWW